MEQAPSRGHEASPQSGLGVGCKRCSRRLREPGDFEVDRDFETFENCHCIYPDHGQGAFASSWRAGSDRTAQGFLFLFLRFSANFRKINYFETAE